jgi:hypothetical protein
VRADVTTFGGTTAGSSDDSVRVKYRSYLEGQHIHTEEPIINSSVVQTQTGPVSIGPGFALLRGYQGDAPEAYLDELEIQLIVGPTALRPGESLAPEPAWTETFGSRTDAALASLSTSKFVARAPYGIPDRTVRLYDPTTAQASGTTVIAFKGSPEVETITQHVPHFAPGADCTTTPLSLDCLLPGGGVFDGTAMWIGHSRFLPQNGSLGPPPIGQASPPAVGRRYDGTDVAADTGSFVRPADAQLFQIPFQDGLTLKKSYLVSADLYVPGHVNTREWFRAAPYAARGPHVDPAWAQMLDINVLGLANKWHRFDVRVDVTTFGGGIGTADDRAEIFLQYVVDPHENLHKSFGGAYVKLDAISAAGTGNLKFGVSYGVARGWQSDALEAFLDNFTAHESSAANPATTPPHAPRAKPAASTTASCSGSRRGRGFVGTQRATRRVRRSAGRLMRSAGCARRAAAALQTRTVATVRVRTACARAVRNVMAPRAAIPTRAAVPVSADLAKMDVSSTRIANPA